MHVELDWNSSVWRHWTDTLSAAFCIDPIWFVILIERALIAPPVGLNLYVVQAVGKARMGEAASGVWPFIIMTLTTVFAIYFLPDIAMYIPFKL